MPSETLHISVDGRQEHTAPPTILNTFPPAGTDVSNTVNPLAILHTCTQQEVRGSRGQQHAYDLQTAADCLQRLAQYVERLRVAIKVGRVPPDKRQLRKLARPVLDDPLHRDRAKDAALCTDPDGSEERLVAQDGDDGREDGFKELEAVECEVTSRESALRALFNNGRDARAVHGLREVRREEHGHQP